MECPVGSAEWIVFIFPDGKQRDPPVWPSKSQTCQTVAKIEVDSGEIGEVPEISKRSGEVVHDLGVTGVEPELQRHLHANRDQEVIEEEGRWIVPFND